MAAPSTYITLAFISLKETDPHLKNLLQQTHLMTTDKMIIWIVILQIFKEKEDFLKLSLLKKQAESIVRLTLNILPALLLLLFYPKSQVLF